MPKRNIAYIKPEEPSFLKKLKEQIGYKEGPTVDTKREALERDDSDGHEDSDDEQPTVVVLKDGDLTAEEAANLKKIAEDERNNAPADLSQRIVFNKPKSKKDDGEESKGETGKIVADKNDEGSKRAGKSGGRTRWDKEGNEGDKGEKGKDKVDKREDKGEKRGGRGKSAGVLSFEEDEYDD